MENQPNQQNSPNAQTGGANNQGGPNSNPGVNQAPANGNANQGVNQAPQASANGNATSGMSSAPQGNANPNGGQATPQNGNPNANVTTNPNRSQARGQFQAPPRPKMSGLGGGGKKGGLGIGLGKGKQKDTQKKQSDTTKEHRYSSVFGSVFLSVGVFVFILSGIVAAGLLYWKGAILDDIQNMSEELEKKQQEVDPGAIADLKRVDMRFAVSKQLLKNHKALTPFFKFLQENTLRKVTFETFDYSHQEDDYIVKMRGIAKDYDTLTLQSNVFEGSEEVKSVEFSSIELTQNDEVRFVVTLVLEPSVLSYGATVLEAEEGKDNKK